MLPDQNMSSARHSRVLARTRRRPDMNFGKGEKIMKNRKQFLKIITLMGLLAIFVGLVSTRHITTAQGNGNNNNAEEFIFGSVEIINDVPNKTAVPYAPVTSITSKAQAEPGTFTTIDFPGAS